MPSGNVCLPVWDSGKRVLGVLQRCDAPLMAQIAAREDVLLLTVTPETRDILLPRLNDWVRGGK